MRWSVWVAAAAMILFVACGGNEEDDEFAAVDTGADTDEDSGTGDTGVDADTGPVCGDGNIDSGEDCDGTNLDGATCADRGFDGGTLACDSACAFDESGCTDDPTQMCGNDMVEGTEACDGTDLNEQTCSDFGFEFGVLTCSDTCTIDATGCGAGPVCGDGAMEEGEECDDGNTDDEDGCAADCVVEFCGDGIVQAGLDEACDSGSLTIPDCDELGSVGVVFCSSECALDEILCPDVAQCGDGTLDLGESCDDGNTEDGDGCSAICQSELCDNGMLDDNEACDGDLLGGFVCSDFGFNGGEVVCDGCAIDISGCRNVVCGDGVVDAPEQCDDGGREDGDGCDRRCREEECADPTEWFPDLDEDGYGAPSEPLTQCTQPPRHADNMDDCDDDDDTVFPGADELCDGADNDCDMAMDEGAPADLCPSDASVLEAACDAGACVIIECAPGAGSNDLADCDGAFANGCEVDPDADLDHCGECDRACSMFPMADAWLCEASQCVPVCGGTTGDCNMSPNDGCEVLLNSLTDCGGCGTMCTIANGTGDCSSFACEVASCNGGFDDCNGDPADGCEINVVSDASNCGGCGVDCVAMLGAGATCDDTICVPAGCPVGFDDCNMDMMDGCETPTTTLTDCGGCGVMCDITNAEESCDTGVCEIAACDPSFGDCNMDPMDGCETPTNTLTDCGGCGVMCNLTNAEESCDMGVCEVAACDLGFGDCNMDPTDGCEAPTNTLLNCGGCGVACNLTNAEESCDMGTCELSACDSGWGDCDMNPLNGCEVSLTSLTNCGGCGVPCAVANGIPTCATTTCEIGLCNTGFDDCNMNPADGCETDVNTLSDCGACGDTCAPANATGICNMGSCEIDSCTPGFEDANMDASDGCEMMCIPTGQEVCGNMIDDDCNGQVDEMGCVPPPPTTPLGSTGGTADMLAAFSIAGEASFDRVGDSVISADLDDDFEIDLLVGARSGRNDSAGRMFVYFSPYTGDLTMSGSDVFIEGDPFARLGAIAVAGFDDDLTTDLVGGASGASEVYVWFGMGDWVAQAPSPMNAGRTYTTPESNDQMGSEVAVGALDGDGFDEVVMTLEGYGANSDGAIAIMGLDMQGIESSGDVTTRGRLITGTTGFQNFGTDVLIGDFDGDFDDDIVVGSGWDNFGGGVFNVGAAHLIPGPLGAGPTETWSTASTSNVLATVDSGELCADMAFVPDMNLNGSDEVACTRSDGTVFVFDFLTFTGDVDETAALFSVATGYGGHPGIAGGDFDGDGDGDLAVGVPSGDGAIYVYFGADVPTGALTLMDAGGDISGLGGWQLGSVLQTIDYNDDFYDDLAVTASAAGVGGRIFVFDGGERP